MMTSRLLLSPVLALLLAASGCNQTTTANPTEDEPQAGKASGKASTSTTGGPASTDASLDELLARATTLAEQEKLDEALGLVEQALTKEPENRQALLMKAALLQFQADGLAAKDRAASLPLFQKSAEAMRTLAAKYKDLRPQERGFLIQTLYQQARALAHQDKPDAAMATLKEAVEAGLDVPEAFEDDEDLDKLADRDDFKALKSTLAEKAEANAKKQAQTLLAEGEPFDFAFELPNLEGESVTLASLLGKKVTIVDIWGTWCPPCRQEIPHFVDLYEKYKGDGLEIVGLTYEQTEDVKDARQKVKVFLETMEITYPLVLTDGAILEKIPNLVGFPTTLFLDSTGKVRLKLVGYHAKAELEAIITALMAEGADTPGEDEAAGAEAATPAESPTAEKAPGEEK